MKKNEPISKIMSCDVLSVHLGQQVSDARKLLAAHPIHHLPVVSNDELIGLISASDILGISVEGIDTDERSMDAYLDHQFSIEKLMVTELKTLSSSAPIREAAEVLSDGNFHAIPIVDDGKLSGILTSTDLIRHLRDMF